jgi:hypothetical protein
MYEDKRPQDLDEQIGNLLKKICCKDPAPTPLERRKALTRLLIQIQRLPHLFRNSHPNYSHALNFTMAWVSEKICSDFSPRSSSVSEDLTRWVNGYLKWRIKDLYVPDEEYQGLIKAGFKPTPLDQPIVAQEGSQTTLGNITADPRFGGMSILDQWIEEIQKDEQKRLGQRIKKYFENDPQSVLKQCHPGKQSDCNCQEIVTRLHLSDPPETVRAIAKQFGINEQTLHSHWKKKCLPLLQIIALRFDPQVKEYIQQDPECILRDCYLPESAGCNCWELSKRIILSESPSLEEMRAIAKDLNTDQLLLDRHWKEKCLPLLKKHRLEYQ